MIFFLSSEIIINNIPTIGSKELIPGKFDDSFKYSEEKIIITMPM
tara:strand:- start:132 stop:266 length:135 start_codon:yes stop_codon:yes gene_type:complete